MTGHDLLRRRPESIAPGKPCDTVLVLLSNGPSGGQNMLYGTGPVSYVDIT